MMTKEERLEYNRQWALNNPEKKRESRKKWRLTHPEEYRKEKAKKWKADLAKFPMLNNIEAARKRAKKFNLPFNISKHDFLVIPDICPVLGIPLIKGAYGKNINNSPSLDRIKPELGYVKENVRIISFRANTIKSNATLAELRLIIQDVESRIGH